MGVRHPARKLISFGSMWLAAAFLFGLIAPAPARSETTSDAVGKVGSFSFGAEAEQRFAAQYRVICGIPDGSPVDLMHPSCPAGAPALDGFRRAIGGTVNGDWSAAFRAYLSKLPEAARAYLVQHCSPEPLTNGACQKEIWDHPSEEWTKAIGSDDAQFEALDAWERLEAAEAYRNVWVYQCARAVGAMSEEKRDGSTVAVVTDESLVARCNVEPSKAWSRDDLRFQKPTCGTDGDCKPRQPDDPELLFLAPGIPAPWELKTQCKPWLSAARSSCIDPADNPYSPMSLLAAGVVQEGQPLSPQAEETYRMVLENQAERMLVRINSFRVGELRDAMRKLAAAAGQPSVTVDEEVRKTCTDANEYPLVQVPPSDGSASPDPIALKKLRSDVASVADDANLIARRLRAQDNGVFSQGGKCGAFETWVEAPDRSMETARASRATCDFERRRRAEYQDQNRALASMYPFLYVELDGKPAFELLAMAQGEQAKSAVLARAYGELKRFELEQVAAICADPVGEQGTFALANEGLMERYFRKFPEERAGAEMLCSLDASRSVLDQNTGKVVEFGGWVGGAASLGAILVPPLMGVAVAADIAFSVDTVDRAWREGRKEDVELGDALAGISLEPGQGREALQLIHRYYGWDRTAEKAGAVAMAAAPWVMNLGTAALGGEARAARTALDVEEEGAEQIVRASRPKGPSAGSTAGADAVAEARPRIEIPDHPPTAHPDGLVPPDYPHVQPEIAPPMLREGDPHEVLRSLETSGVRSAEFITDSEGRRIGLSGAKKVVLADGTEGVFKAGDSSHEVAAYNVSELLDLDLVPPTVRRSINGSTGSFQEFIPNARMGTEAEALSAADQSKLRFFDWLIDNVDRHEGNYLLTADGKLVAIDHFEAFGTSAVKLPTGEAFKGIIPGEAVVRELRSTTELQLRSALESAGLDSRAIERTIERRAQFLAAYDEYVAKGTLPGVSSKPVAEVAPPKAGHVLSSTSGTASGGGAGSAAGPVNRWGPPPKRGVPPEPPALYAEDVPEPRALPRPLEPPSPTQARGPPPPEKVRGPADVDSILEAGEFRAEAATEMRTLAPNGAKKAVGNVEFPPGSSAREEVAEKWKDSFEREFVRQRVAGVDAATARKSAMKVADQYAAQLATSLSEGAARDRARDALRATDVFSDAARADLAGTLSDYRAGAIGYSGRKVAAELGGKSAKEVQSFMDAEVSAGKCSAVSDPVPIKGGGTKPQTVYVYPDGTMVRVKPEGDQFTGNLTYSVEVLKRGVSKPRDIHDVAFKLDGLGNPVPKSPAEMKNPYNRQTNPVQYKAYEAEVMRAGHHWVSP